MDPLSALLAGAALHAGFQLVVTLVVYPALAAAPERSWAAVHAAHSRRITPVVALVYGGVLATWAWVLATTALSGALVLAGAGSALAGAATALVAGPTHARLGREGPRPQLLRRLRRADAVRLAGALLALAATALAVR
ncbi:hypothetical protein [Kineococcus indalonis]|uniref:hypothetical protein n=1 Tax=Kineococcus indalonis TaxID=2696566 RepID=UPI001412D640|nr:hypothetical protein [Kineococcus indalonis]NAZ87745.1 hypothetical protein [Kineococcus indalonis]